MYADLERQVQTVKVANRTQINQQRIASQVQGQKLQYQFPTNYIQGQQQPIGQYTQLQTQQYVNQTYKPTVPGVPFVLSVENLE
jgi:hypothetical protein